MEAKHKQWTLTLNEETGEYKLQNLGPNGERQYYEVVAGKYGEPVIVPEPDLAFAPPLMVNYQNAKGEGVSPEENISGIICQNGPRLSLTNAKNKGVAVKVTDEGVEVNGEMWYVATLFMKDKARIKNYDAYLVRTKPAFVRVLELGDLDLF